MRSIFFSVRTSLNLCFQSVWITLWELAFVQQEKFVSNQDKLLLRMRATWIRKQKQLFYIGRITASVFSSVIRACVEVICLDLRQISPIVLSHAPRVLSEHSGSTDLVITSKAAQYLSVYLREK